MDPSTEGVKDPLLKASLLDSDLSGLSINLDILVALNLLL